MLGRREFIDWRTRKERDRELKQSLASHGFKVPEVLHDGEVALELEEVERQAIRECMEGDGNPRKAGELVGEFLKNLHNSQICLLDNSLYNFLTCRARRYTLSTTSTVLKAPQKGRRASVSQTFTPTFSLYHPRKDEISGRVLRMPTGR
ncbi:MAG: hypothetical protein ABEJ07_06385 [Candidatus Nanohaloarchaea archaeon]